MKKRVDDLAILGGPPAFAAGLHVGRPNIGDQKVLKERIAQILDTRWLTNQGPFVEQFERRLSDLLGAEHCVAVCNGTLGLELTIRALGLSGEVIVPSFTFIATAHALQWLGIRPVFCDVDPETHNINPELVRDRVTPRTTGILGVHLWGRPCDIQGLERVAEEHGLCLLFDAAHALACSYQGRMIGNFGNAEVFSFHATKFVNSFEGGAVVTNDGDLAAQLRLMRNFGFTDYDQVDHLGTNAKMSEIAAAMGLTSLESMEQFVAANFRNYHLYRRELQNISGISIVRYDESESANYQYLVLEVDEQVTGISRDQLLEVLRAENVLARRYFYPGCHRMAPYRSSSSLSNLMPLTTLVQTERLADRVLCLPTGKSVEERDIVRICDILRLATNHGADLSCRLLQSRQLWRAVR